MCVCVCVCVPAGWFSPPVWQGPKTYSADGKLVPPQTCVGTVGGCPQPTTYVGPGWSQWTSLSSGGECGLAYKINPILDTDQARPPLPPRPRPLERVGRSGALHSGPVLRTEQARRPGPRDFPGAGAGAAVTGGGGAGAGAQVAGRTWFTTAMGPVTFVHFSTERDISVGSAQYAWLAATLRAVDRDATPWLVVAGHRPGYVDSNAASDQACVCVCVCARARACINVGSRGVM